MAIELPDPRFGVGANKPAKPKTTFMSNLTREVDLATIGKCEKVCCAFITARSGLLAASIDRMRHFVECGQYSLLARAVGERRTLRGLTQRNASMMVESVHPNDLLSPHGVYKLLKRLAYDRIVESTFTN